MTDKTFLDRINFFVDSSMLKPTLNLSYTSILESVIDVFIDVFKAILCYDSTP